MSESRSRVQGWATTIKNTRSARYPNSTNLTYFSRMAYFKRVFQQVNRVRFEHKINLVWHLFKSNRTRRRGFLFSCPHLSHFTVWCWDSTLKQEKRWKRDRPKSHLPPRFHHVPFSFTSNYANNMHEAHHIGGENLQKSLLIIKGSESSLYGLFGYTRIRSLWSLTHWVGKASVPHNIGRVYL